MTKDYTNTREPGEFGDGATVEQGITDEAVEAAVDKWRDHEFDGLMDFPRMRAALEAALPHLLRGEVKMSAPLHDALQRWRDEDHEDTIALSREQVIDLCEEYRAALTAALPHMGGVSEEMLIAAFLRGESWRKRNDVDRYVAVPEMVEKAARDYADAILSALASHEPAPKSDQTGEALEITHDRAKQARVSHFESPTLAEVVDGFKRTEPAKRIEHGIAHYLDQFDRSPYVDPSVKAKDGPEVVGYLVQHPKEGKDFQWAPLTTGDKDNGYSDAPLIRLSDYEALRAENERLRIERITAERDAADYMKRLNKAAGKLSIAENVIAELVKALEPFANAKITYLDAPDGREVKAKHVHGLVYGDFRRARAALHPEREG